jgi:hypothetical protein
MSELQNREEGQLVVPPRFFSKSEESEEDQSAEYNYPSVYLRRDNSDMVLPPEQSRVLFNAPEIDVSI